MDRTEVLRGQLVVGVPIPWTIFDVAGKKLADKGFVFRSAEQIERVLARGAFRSDAPWVRGQHKVAKGSAGAVQDTPRTIFQRMVSVRDKLRALYKRWFEEGAEGGDADLATEVRRLAAELRDICHADTDAALAASMLSLVGDYRVDNPLHSAVLVEVLGERMERPESERVSLVCGALTHDIGILDIQNEIERQVTPLSDEQWAKIRKHPGAGAEMLRRYGVSDPIWLDVVAHHHERMDGSGYPESLQGDEISFFAKMMAVSDIYSAMVRPRPYRGEMLNSDALKSMFMERGSAVDEQLTSGLVSTLGIYPPGTFLRLKGGELAMSARRGDKANKPLIYALTTTQGNFVVKPKERDISEVAVALPARKVRALWGMAEACY